MCARLSQGPLSPGSICSLNQDMEAQPYPLSPFSAGSIIQHREVFPQALVKPLSTDLAQQP